jgi:hypothetical protein
MFSVISTPHFRTGCPKGRPAIFERVQARRKSPSSSFPSDAVLRELSLAAPGSRLGT